MRSIRKFTAAMVVAGLAAALSAVAAAQVVIRVGSVADSRFGTSWTLDGVQMANTRAKLLNTANFGVGGTVAKSIAITDTAATPGSVNAGLLASFDVFFIGYLTDGGTNAFTAGELAAMQAWVTAGGTMVVTCDDANYDAVCALFGHPADPAGPSINPIVATAAGAAHPLFAGPFGVPGPINMVGTQGAFTNTTGATVLAQDSTPGTSYPAVLVRGVGAGRVILLADVDLIANGASAGGAITTGNDRFLGNVFAYAGNAASPPPPVARNAEHVPTLSEWALLIMALLVASVTPFALRRRAH